MRPRSPVFAHDLRRRLVRTAVLSVGLFGCAPWARIPAPAPAALPPTTTLQLWLAGQPVVLREITVTPDSIRGRTVNPAKGTSAALVVLPRTAVDSVRLLVRDTQNSFGAGALLGLVAGVGGLFAIFGRSGT